MVGGDLQRKVCVVKHIILVHYFELNILAQNETAISSGARNQMPKFIGLKNYVLFIILHYFFPV